MMKRLRIRRVPTRPVIGKYYGMQLKDRRETKAFLRRLDDHQARVAAMFEANGVNYWGDARLASSRDPEEQATT